MAQLLVNGYNVGTELQSVILLANAAGITIDTATLGHLRELSAEQQITTNTITPAVYNGLRLHRNIYHDWSGTLNFDRYNGNLTNLMNGIQQSFQLNGAETYFTMFATIFDTTYVGQEDLYMFSQVVLGPGSFGSWGGTGEVQQSISWRCQGMVITGTSANVLSGQ
jgi:hypothetical protein